MLFVRGAFASRRSCSCVVLLGALVSACRADPPAAPAEVVYDGATSIGDRILRDAVPALRTRSGISVKIQRSGTGKGLEAALAGKVDVAGVARSLTPAELARRPYFQIIGYDALAVFVNEANPVRAITRSEARALFAGEARSWKDVGGPPLPVAACTEHVSSGRATVEAIRGLLLEGGAFGPIRELEDPSDCVAWVAAERGGVTVATVTMARPGVRALTLDGLDPTPQNVRASTYPLTRPLLLVAPAAPAGPVRTVFEFLLSPEGQQIVGRNGFVPAR
jgi:phosphate transport system substrate-binding protein